MHTIIDATWTPKVNVLLIKCGRCYDEFRFPANRVNVSCPQCGSYDNMHRIKSRGAELNGNERNK